MLNIYHVWAGDYELPENMLISLRSLARFSKPDDVMYIFAEYPDKIKHQVPECYEVLSLMDTLKEFWDEDPYGSLLRDEKILSNINKRPATAADFYRFRLACSPKLNGFAYADMGWVWIRDPRKLLHPDEDDLIAFEEVKDFLCNGLFVIPRKGHEVFNSILTDIYRDYINNKSITTSKIMLNKYNDILRSEYTHSVLVISKEFVNCLSYDSGCQRLNDGGWTERDINRFTTNEDIIAVPLKRQPTKSPTRHNLPILDKMAQQIFDLKVQ